MASERDFTCGSIPRHLAVLFGPLLAASVFQQLYTAADALLIGYCVGAEAFAAAGIAQTLCNLLVFLLIGLASGPTVVVGHGLGGRRLDEARRASGSALTAGLGVAASIALFSAAIAEPVLALLGTPAAFMGDALVYVWWTAASLPVVYAANLSAGLLRTVGNTTTPFGAFAAAALVNIGLDYLFMGPGRLGVGGAAAATLLAQGVAALVCGFCLQRHSSLRLSPSELIPRRCAVLSMARLSSAASLQAASLYVGKILVQAVVNGLGTGAIIAYAAVLRIEGLAQAAGEAGQAAGVALISQNHGARESARVRASFRWLLGAMIAAAACIGAAMFAFAEPLVALFAAGDAGAMAEGVPYLRIIAVAYVLCLGGNAWVARFHGMGHFGTPLAATTLQIYTRVVLSFWWAPALDLAGIAWATVVGWVLLYAAFVFGAISCRLRERQEECVEVSESSCSSLL